MSEYPFPKASIQHRLGQFFLEIGLLVVTLGIGYLVWWLIVLGKGQTPGKQVLKLRVYDETTGKPAKWGHMFIREFGLITGVNLVLLVLTLVHGLRSFSEFFTWDYLLTDTWKIDDTIGFIILAIDAFWIFKSDKRRRLVDIICKTDVLNEAAK
jgi:uncharacterized RDD family membrane protein YckC